MLKKLKPYIISIAVSLFVGILSAVLTSGSMNVYDSIRKPMLSPPPWLFPVVWTVLFILMGVSAALVYTNKAASYGEKSDAYKVYGLQLLFNFIWSLIFFNMRNYFLAFIWLVLLWLLILTMIIKFYKINPKAGYLQIPYLLWVTFAGYLNFMIFILN